VKKTEKERQQITVQTRPEIADLFFAATFLRGLNMSAELHRHMVEYIRSVQRDEPDRLQELAEEHRIEREENRRENKGKGSKARKPGPEDSERVENPEREA
jgi:hypothetical protein